MKKILHKITALVLLCVLTAGLGACGNADGSGTGSRNSGGATETFTVKPLALWYLATDSTDDNTGAITAYSSAGYSSLSQWGQENEGGLLTGFGQSENRNLSLTVNESQKKQLLETVQKKYRQALEELPSVCDLFERAEISEADPAEFDLFFDPDAWLETDTLSVPGLMKFENLIILGDFWQLMEELENGPDFVGTVVWKNADTGYRLLSLSSDPEETDSVDFAAMAVRHTNYGDYDGTLDFTATYLGAFTDDAYDGTFYEFEVTDDSCYAAGERVCFHADAPAVEVSEGDSVTVTFSGDSTPDDYVFTSHGQEPCFDDGVPYEMTPVSR